MTVDWYVAWCTLLGILVGYMLRDRRPVVHVIVPEPAREPIVELTPAALPGQT